MVVISDRGPQFISHFWSEFCSLLGATVSLSSGFHPQSNGQAERMNQEMETVCALASHNPSSWSKQLLWIEYAHNTLPSSATGLSPFQCSWGYQPPLFPEQEHEASVPSVQHSSGVVNALGCRPAPPFCTPPTVTNGLPIDVASLHPVTLWGSVSGYLRTFPSEWSPRSWLPGSWAHSPS